MRKRKNTIIAAVAGLAAGCLLMLAGGAFGAGVNGGTLNLNAGVALNANCPNALTDTNVAANSETLNCAANTTTTTAASTTTTVPVTTTTVPVTTTTVPSGGGGQTCTSAPSGHTNGGAAYVYPQIVGSNGFNTYVANNMWGPNAGTTQTICATDPGNVTLAASAVPSDYTGVQTYPDISQLMNDYCGADTWGGCASPVDTPIADLHTLSSNYNVTDPAVATGDWEAAYDIWISNNASQNEIMIWVNTSTQRLNNNGAQICNPNVMIGGQSYTYQAYQTCGTGTPQLVLNSNASSGTVDILGVLKFLIAQKIEPANATIGELDFGWEICNTAGQTQHFASTGYTLSAS